MKQYLTEFDELQAALKKVRIDENVMPYHMGRLVEDEDSYNKIQKLLDCPQMAGSHRYLYDLDVENLQEGEIDKINQLFDLGVKKGYIDNSFEEEFEKEQNPDAIIADEPETCSACNPAMPQKFNASVPCWTILYSATKNGEIKSGECYSNAVSVSAAKADCLAKLSKFGYENVAVLAIEAGDPDMCGADVNECGVKEDDIIKGRSHNLHKVEEDADADSEDESEELDETGKNPYIAGMKVVTGGKVSTTKPAAKKTTKKLKEDDEEGDDDAEDTGDTEDAEDTEDADDTSSDDTSADDSDDAEGSDDDGAEGGEDSGEETLDDSKKAQYKNEYRRIFQEVMAACKFGGKSFNDLTIDEKVKFFTKLKERWTKADPKEFMSDKEQDQLESITIEGGDAENTEDEGSEDTESTDTEGEDTEGEDTESGDAEGSEDTEDEDTEGAEGAEDAEDEGSDDTEGEDTEGEDTEGEDTEE